MDKILSINAVYSYFEQQLEIMSLYIDKNFAEVFISSLKSLARIYELFANKPDSILYLYFNSYNLNTMITKNSSLFLLNN